APTFRFTRSFDESANECGAAAARNATPIGKYWINKRVVNLAYEAMEVHGGSGYVEDGVMTRIYRQSPLNSIWEGSGSVVCFDILRAIRRDPDSERELVAELVQSRGTDSL